MQRIKKNTQKSDKIVIKFDVPMLNTLINFSLSNIPSKIQLGDLQTLIGFLDLDGYRYNSDILNRILIIKETLNARLNHNLRDYALIKSMVVTNEPDTETEVNDIVWEPKEMTIADCNYLSDCISEKIQYAYLFQAKDEIIDLLEKMNKAEFISYADIVFALKQELSKLLVKLQNSSISQGLVRAINFSSPEFVKVLDRIVTKSKKPTAILRTGIRALNALLSPGFESGRLYTFLGLSGKFKSGTLLNIADQLRKFNPQLESFENHKRNTILFVTMENTIEETVGRIFDMYSTNEMEENFKTLTTDQVIHILRERGNYKFTDTEGIDIEIRFFQNLEINTSNLYNIIQEINDNDRSVICLILDYLKRIDSTFDSKGDERLRLSYVAKELKNLATFFDIPVITAMQINREGNSIVDAAMRDDKHDLLKFVGAGNIANSWDIVEESDWMAIVNLERKVSTGQLFLTFKRVKIRGKSDPMAKEYFNHPFENDSTIKLLTDEDKPYSMSVMSLASDLESVDQKKIEGGQERPKLEKKARNKDSVLKAISGLDQLME